MTHEADALWLSDDPLPPCAPCRNSIHGSCLDLYDLAPYGVVACTCEVCE